MLRYSFLLLLLCVCATAAPPTIAEAQKFIEDAEARLLALNADAQRADWVKSTFITDDTEAMAAQANEKAIALQVDLVKQAQRFAGLKLPPELDRKFPLLQVSLTIAAPQEPALSSEVTRIVASMEGQYGKGKYCKSGKCRDLDQLSDELANNRNASELADAWTGWHAISPPMRPQYQRFVELSNKGAKELGFADTGALWRARYDMPPDEFAAELDRLWLQVRPLYLSLHAYVRKRLREHYGSQLVPAHGPIPAQLLGNMWAQDWSEIYPLVAPKDADRGYDLTKILKDRKTAA
jgi:peptidyl-dipeptidase A